MSPRSASTSLTGAAYAAGTRARRQMSHAFLHVPQHMRALVRADEIWLVVLAACVGIAGGLVVTYWKPG